jgi:hypothetical protein
VVNIVVPGTVVTTSDTVDGAGVVPGPDVEGTDAVTDVPVTDTGGPVATVDEAVAVDVSGAEMPGVGVVGTGGVLVALACADVTTDEGGAVVDATETVDTGGVMPNSVDTEAVAPDTVDSGGVMPNSVDTETVAPDTVDSGSVTPNSVETETVAPDTVDSGGVTPNSVDTEAVAPDTVDSGGVMPNSVDTETVAPDTVDGASVVAGPVVAGTDAVMDDLVTDEGGPVATTEVAAAVDVGGAVIPGVALVDTGGVILALACADVTTENAGAVVDAAKFKQNNIHSFTLQFEAYPQLGQ